VALARAELDRLTPRGTYRSAVADADPDLRLSDGTRIGDHIGTLLDGAVSTLDAFDAGEGRDGDDDRDSELLTDGGEEIEDVEERLPSIDGGLPLHDLNDFARDLLWLLAAVEPASGQEVRTALEAHPSVRTNHGRLYSNLDRLVDRGLVERGRRDRRTNSYQLTQRGRHALARRREWEATLAGRDDYSDVDTDGHELVTDGGRPRSGPGHPAADDTPAGMDRATGVDDPTPRHEYRDEPPHPRNGPAPRRSFDDAVGRRRARAFAGFDRHHLLVVDDDPVAAFDDRGTAAFVRDTLRDRGLDATTETVPAFERAGSAVIALQQAGVVGERDGGPP
jgi:DNA-binding PadR family transcriptional regulator